MQEDPKPTDVVAWDILVESAPNTADALDEIERAWRAGVDFNAMLEVQAARLQVQP